jgi:hypothetical protein
MVDPLSITLAAVTLATALKDIIEVAQKIEQSFAKVSSPPDDENVSQSLLFPLPVGFSESPDCAKAV